MHVKTRKLLFFFFFAYVDFYFKSPRTVAVVDEAGYLRCDASGAQINDVSGSFSYTFTKSGIVSFISAGAGDCAAGLKMQFLVL